MPPAHVSVSSINGAKDHGVSDAVPVITLSPRDYDAVLFDLDGVLTRTASVHAAAWKKLFDGFLEQRATGDGRAIRPLRYRRRLPALRRRQAALRRRGSLSRSRAGSTCRWVHPKTARTCKAYTRSAI